MEERKRGKLVKKVDFPPSKKSKPIPLSSIVASVVVTLEGRDPQLPTKGGGMDEALVASPLDSLGGRTLSSPPSPLLEAPNLPTFEGKGGSEALFAQLGGHFLQSPSKYAKALFNTIPSNELSSLKTTSLQEKVYLATHGLIMELLKSFNDQALELASCKENLGMLNGEVDELRMKTASQDARIANLIVTLDLAVL
ncbi:unnamed protein product [Ilex paraguariensis]|uniref:Uncharacterized protein n=1 Tax=Ilex paraguariensis TaxID=185542 RepID=A0ABC8V0A5_9AQUA